MAVQKIKRTQLYMGRLWEQKSASLMESVHSSINTARVQVGKSLQIVAQSRDLVDRTRQSLARANHIQQGLTSPAHNPVIVTLSERNEQA